MDEDVMRERQQKSAVDGLPLSGEPLPLDLVNTTYVKGGVRGRLIDALAAPQDLDVWLRGRRERFSAPLAADLAGAAPADLTLLGEFLEVRRALRVLAGARTSGGAAGPADLAVVNAWARRAAAWQELAPGPEFPVASRRSESDSRRAALAEIAAQAVALFGGAGAELLRACPAPGCVLYFVKSHSRREWCTTGCGNRVRVARHSRRGREGVH
ncbi:ABATE domain-containing protein [Streptomyces sp. NPDC002809]|uniref:CGNR zinc finger domain-containing protein n=1 Tax=Streptomyces sp. NPDC002809 TaxID=3154433 RepID=UPI003324DD71